MNEPINSLPSPTRNVRRRQGQALKKAERAEIQAKFLKSFAINGNVLMSARQVNISRNVIYLWLKNDPTFAENYKLAEEDASEVIYAELFRRAMQGVDKPLVSMGRLVLDENEKPIYVKEYSDKLLSDLARARVPGFKPEQKIEHVGKGGGAIEFVTEWGGGALAESEEDSIA